MSIIKRFRIRTVRAAITGLSSVAAKGLAGVVNLISIPLTLNYLGRDRFGLWMTIASLQAILAFADFGLGNGLLNTVADALGRGDRTLIARAVRAALALQCIVAGALVAIFCLVYPYVDWPSLLHVSDAIAAREAGPAILIFVIVYCVRSITVVVQQAQLGLQQGYIANFWTAVGNLSALAGVFAAAAGRASVPMLCLTVAGLPVAAGLINVLWWLATRLPRPEPGGAPSDHAHVIRPMMRVGMLFFLLQVAAALNVGIDPLIVNGVLGPAAVTDLAVVQKPFELLGVFLLLLLQPLWPAYREALSSGDIGWIRNTFRRVLAITLAISLCIAIFMGLAGQWLLTAWSRAAVHPSEALILAYCAVHLFTAFQTPLAFLFNGLGRIRFQLVLGLPAIAASVALKIILLPRIGLTAVPWTTVAVGVIFLVPAQLWYLKRLRRQLDAYGGANASHVHQPEG